LYKVNVNTLEIKTLTSGKWEVTDAFLSKDGKHFYLTSSEIDPGERHFYKMSTSGGQRTKITNLTGNNEVNLSPDEKNLAIRFSYSNKPWELYLQKNDQKSSAEKITDSRFQNFKKFLIPSKIPPLC
jgi:dipeptidyl aminopeptidase/acylaminoacyl peptidase